MWYSDFFEIRSTEHTSSGSSRVGSVPGVLTSHRSYL